MREHTTHTRNCHHLRRSRTQPRRGVTVIEVAAAVALFMLSVGLLTAVITSAISSRSASEESVALDSALGRLATAASTIDAVQLRDGNFDVPEKCADTPDGAGAAGASCIVVGSSQHRVFWTFSYGPRTSDQSPPEVEERAAWVEVTARTEFGGGWRSRSASASLPPTLMPPIPPTPAADDAEVTLFTAPVTVRQGRTAVLVVTALDGRYEPSEDFLVQITPQGGDPQDGVTDEQGRVSFSLPIAVDAPVGVVEVSVVGGAEPTSTIITVTPRPASLVTSTGVVNVQPDGTLRVEVAARGSAGEAVAGVGILAESSSADVRVTPSATTDTSGSAVFTLRRPAGATGEATVTFTGDEGITLNITVL